MMFDDNIVRILQSFCKCFAMIDFTSSLRTKKFILYDVVNTKWFGPNIYILYISVISLSHLSSKFFLRLRSVLLHRFKKHMRRRIHVI
jgi:hypothetical protein